MDDENIQLLTTTLKETFTEGVTQISSRDLEDFKYVIDRIAKNISLSIMGDDVDSILSGIDLSVDNICGQFGSPTSRDMDFFVVLREPKSTKFMDAVREYYKVWFRGMFQARMLEYTGADIQFIAVDHHGTVNWSERYDNTEINNAIFHTYQYHSLNMIQHDGTYRPCPVTSPVRQEVAIKALKSIRSLLTFISRTHYRELSKRLLFEDSLGLRTKTLTEIIEGDGLLENIISFDKPNRSTTDILKSLSFSFIQLSALVNGHSVPFTKNAAITTPTPRDASLVLSPVLLGYDSASVDEDMIKKELDALILCTLRDIDDMIVHDDNGVLKLQGDSSMYHVRKEQPIDPYY